MDPALAASAGVGAAPAHAELAVDVLVM